MLNGQAAYYNEIDPFAAQWLRNLIAAGHVAAGDVDERSILDVSPDDLSPYTQCHFFAGIGGWSHALRLAGWPDDRPVWTGSCPCQPFSAAGKQRGSDDERHLWPAFFDLIRQRRPTSVFGEQVAGTAGLAWLDHVCADLEDAGYAAAAANLCAAGAGAPHIRQRLYWVAHAGSVGRERGQGAAPRRIGDGNAAGRIEGHDGAAGADETGLRLAYVTDVGWRRERQDRRRLGTGDAAQGRATGLEPGGDAGDLGNADSAGLEVELVFSGVSCGASGTDESETAERADPLASERHDAWSTLDWIQCRDGKARPTQPGLFPLAHGISNRVGRLRAYGNAIVPQVAAAFVMASKSA